MSFPRYPKYKDSGVEWLSEVPEHWSVIPLKRVGAIRYGIGEPPTYHPEGTPLIRATNVHAGRLFTEGLVYVDPSEIPSQRIVWLEVGDIIVVRSGAYTGDSAIIPTGFGKSIAGFDMVLKLHGVHPPFVQYALLSHYLKERQIDLEKMRAAQPHLNAEELGSSLIILPGGSEQTAIAAFLDRETGKIDALVAEQRRLIELLKEKRQAVISHAVTKGLDPNAKLKPSGIEWLGDVPERWLVMKVKHVIRSIEQGWSPQCEGFPVESPDQWGVLKVGCVNTGVFNPSENKVLPELLEPIPSLAIAKGDLLISRANTRELVGCAAVAEADYPKLILCDKLYRLRLQPSKCDPVFLSLYLSSDRARGPIEIAASGASASMVNIGQSVILEMAIAVPPAREQGRIIDHLRNEAGRLESLTTEAALAIQLLQERRTALISAAVTGKIDVRGLVETEAA